MTVTSHVTDEGKFCSEGGSRVHAALQECEVCCNVAVLGSDGASESVAMATTKEHWSPKLPPKELKFPTTVAATVCDYLERAIVWWFDDYASKQKNPWYQGNYGPTTEMAPAKHLPVSGTIPVISLTLSVDFPSSLNLSKSL